MARRRHLIAYDIAEPTRLRRICKLMEDFGSRLQYSVFLCDLSVGELSELEVAAREIMNLNEDSIIEIDLGPVSSPAPIRSIGRQRQLPERGTTIV